jgi:hypothetical protein
MRNIGPDQIERERAAQEELRNDRAKAYAKNLAIAIHAKHYPEVTQWKPLDDTLGLLTQIDNMTSGLVRPALRCDGCGKTIAEHDRMGHCLTPNV